MHLVEGSAVDLALYELDARVRRGRVYEPAVDVGQAGWRSGAVDAGRHRLVPRCGLGRVGHADHLAELDRELDGRRRARQPLGLVRVEQRVGGEAVEHEVELPRQVGGVAQARAHALAGERWHEVGGVAGEEHVPGPPLVGTARVERVDGVAFEARVAGVHVPRLEQLPRPLLVVQLVDATRGAGA